MEIPVIGGKNILDWTAAANRADEVKYDPALGLLLPATSVPSPQFVHVTVWMLLWKNPHPDKQIVALEVKGEGAGHSRPARPCRSASPSNNCGICKPQPNNN